MIDPKPGAWVWPAAMIVWGPGSTSAGHSHHCVQLVMVLEGKLRIRSRPGVAWRTCGAALVRPDAEHEVDGRGRTVLIGFVDPESKLGAALTERIKGDISRVPATQVERWRLSLGSKLTPMGVERWVRQDLLKSQQHAKIHPGVRRVISARESRQRNTPFTQSFSRRIRRVGIPSRARLYGICRSSYSPLYSVASIATGML